MGIKKRNRVSAEFSMSSLTDIIFLLLIFFMLTSNLVAPNALNLKLPGKSNPSVSSSNPPDVSIRRDGTFYLDDKRINSEATLLQAIRRLRNNNGGKQLDITISPHPDSPIEKLVAVMDIAMRLKVNAILATEE
ncbi:MAG: biopolymer transporter ExbD [Bacteroidota bacterium]